MARQSYKKNISPAKSIKRKKPTRNARQKKAAIEGIVERFKKGYARHSR